MTQAAYLYKITSTLNGMQYIGVTVNPKKRWNSHCRPAKSAGLLLKNAILKHGKENFKMEILFQAPQAYCYEMEPKLIEAYQTLSPSGYNLTAGGMGSLGLVGEKNGCYGRSGELHPNFGKKGYRSGVSHTKETKEKMSVKRVGKKHSPETIEKIRAGTKRRFANPDEVARMKSLGFFVGRPRAQGAK
jgi:group I intron endonuclease